MLVTYIEKGIPVDYKRIDKEVTISLLKAWEVGGLLYGYRDRFNVVSISKEDIIRIEK